MTQLSSYSLETLTLTPTAHQEQHRRLQRGLTQMAEEKALAPATALDMESKVKTAMVSRVPYFKEQADSLTFEGVRRLLEKDLGLDTFALDVHKRFVKQCLQEVLVVASSFVPSSAAYIFFK